MSALDSAYARRARADECFAELNALHREVCDAQAKATVVHTNPAGVIGPGEVGHLLFVDNRIFVHDPVPERCAILAGDVANSLRTALNYLVIQLAILDTGSKGRNQFPIEETPESFKGNTTGKRGFLNGLSTAHFAAIEQLQPYNGCDWTRALGKISNFDKHEDLVIIRRDQLIGFRAVTEPATDTKIAHIQMHVDIQSVLIITLNDGMPLIKTLEVIQTQVSQVLDAFKPEFE